MQGVPEEEGLLGGEEEVGFVGGRAYVAQHLKDQASRDRISVYLNNDPGGGATYGWYMANNAAARAIFDAWLEPLKDLGLKRNVSRFPFVPSDAAKLDELCSEAYNIQVHGLKQRLQSSKTSKIVIGVSGGLDSTQALIVGSRSLSAALTSTCS